MPREIEGLHEFYDPRDPSWIDKDGRLIWSDGKVVVNFGGHKGKTLESVAKTNTSYLQWVLTSDFPSKFKEIVTDAINGKFPKQ